MTKAKDLQRRIKFCLSTALSTRPAMYYGIRHLSGKFDHLCITRDTDIVIEGYPRSANSTTVQKFLSRQNSPVQVAHHKHHAAQLLRAAEWGIPAVVLIRSPREACLSLMALGAEGRVRRGEAATSHLRYKDVFGAYLAFYEAVELLLDSIIVAPFETIKDDIGPMIERVNARFGTDFEVAEKDDSAAVDQLGWHAMPNDLRGEIKQEIESSFEAELATSTRLPRTVSRAEALHERILAAQ